MDIETFYHSRWPRIIFSSLGALIALIGLLTFSVNIVSLIYAKKIVFRIFIASSISFMLLGITIHLIAYQLKKRALFFLWIAIIFSLIQIFLFPFIQDQAFFTHALKLLNRDVATTLAQRGISGAILFLIIECSLFSFCSRNTKKWALWITGVLAGTTFGFALLFLYSNLMAMEYIPIGHVKGEISLLSSTLFALLACGVLFYGGLFYNFYFPLGFPLWGATFFGVSSFFLAFASWISFSSREHEMITEINIERAYLFQDNISSDSLTYLFTLNRLEKRLGVKENDPTFWEDESKRYLEDFPWLLGIGVFSPKTNLSNFKNESLQEYKSDILKQISEHAKKSAPYEAELIFCFFPKDSSDIFLVTYSPFAGQADKFLYSIFSAEQFFYSLIPQYLRDDQAIIIQVCEHPILEINTHCTKYRNKYLTILSSNFFGSPLRLELWPTAKFIAILQSAASWFQLVIGMALAVAMFLAFYLFQIAHRKKKEAEIANKEKSQFLANMSHEIRTPLHGIIGGCSILELSEINPDQRKWVTSISKSSYILLDLINDLLDLSKLETGGISIHLTEVNLYELMKDTFDFFAPKAKEKNLSYTFHFDNELPHFFFVDPKRVRQITTNLLSNALKYTKTGFVKLEISGQKMEKNIFLLLIKISDSGPGIPKEEFKNIFSKYIRLDIRAEEGSGIGLPLVKRLLEMLGGNIEVKSTLGEGSVFTANFQAKQGHLEEENGKN